MATYSSRHAKLWVRSPAPHPIRLVRRLFAACLAVLALSVSVNAETYTAAGQKFVGNGSTFSSIGGYATSSMTFAGTGGIMLYNAFSNLDKQIETVRAASVTSTSLDTVFSKYFGSSGIFNSYFGSKISDILNTRLSNFSGRLGHWVISIASSEISLHTLRIRRIGLYIMVRLLLAGCMLSIKLLVLLTTILQLSMVVSV